MGHHGGSLRRFHNLPLSCSETFQCFPCGAHTHTPTHAHRHTDFTITIRIVVHKPHTDTEVCQSNVVSDVPGGCRSYAVHVIRFYIHLWEDAPQTIGKWVNKSIAFIHHPLTGPHCLLLTSSRVFPESQTFPRFCRESCCTSSVQHFPARLSTS